MVVIVKRSSTAVAFVGLSFHKLHNEAIIIIIIFFDRITSCRVATNLENLENSGNMKNCENLREI